MSKHPLLQQYPLPDGYNSRPLTMDDAEIVAGLYNEYAWAMGEKDAHFNPEQTRKNWSQEDFDLGASSIAVFDADDNLVACGTLGDTSNPPIHPWINAAFHPEQYDSGVPEHVMAWLINLSQRTIDRCPPKARISLRAGTIEGYDLLETVYQNTGFVQTRRWLDMRIDMTEAPPEAQLPEGFFIRHYKHPDDLRITMEADNAGFRDHWGHIERSTEEQLKIWTHWVESDLLFDETLWFLAIEAATDTVAGVCLCRKEKWNNPAVAYVDSLAVVPAYRRKRLALAMLHHTFDVFWQRGQKSVMLDVDATSLTNATDLYEKAGMYVYKSSATWEHELRDGEELATTELT